MNKFNLNRRQMLKGTGVALALPFLESLAIDKKSNAAPPKRLIVSYMAYGCFMPNAKNGIQDMKKAADPNGWWPCRDAGPLTFNKVQKSFEPLKKYVSYLEGLDHKGGYKAGGHSMADIFATGAFLAEHEKTNNISIDQVAAKYKGHETRYASLTLGAESGTGAYGQSKTLSHYGPDNPVPAMSDPKTVFAHLFEPYKGNSVEVVRRQLSDKKSMLDSLLAQSKSLHKSLGKADQGKMKEYLQAIRDVEKRIERIDKWTHVPTAKPDVKNLKLDATVSDPEEYIRCMYELLFLALQTDTTRFGTFMTEDETDSSSPSKLYPQKLFGFKKNTHGLSHNRELKVSSSWETWRATQHAYFLQRLKDTDDGNGTNMLDNTVVLWGSGHPHGAHSNRNYPVQIAGGNKLGFNHGNLHKFVGNKKVPLANLFVSMLNAVDVPVKKFADSTGTINELRSV